jgi:hypothetical protein
MDGPGSGQGCEQPNLVPVSVFRALDRHAVQPHLHQYPRACLLAGIAAGRDRRGEPGEVHQSRTDRRVGRSVPASVSTRQIVVFDGGGAGAAPLRRYRIGQDRRRQVSDPARDRGIALHPGHDRCRSQRQHGRNRMIPALARPAIRRPVEQSQHTSEIGPVDVPEEDVVGRRTRGMRCLDAHDI